MTWLLFAILQSFFTLALRGKMESEFAMYNSAKKRKECRKHVNVTPWRMQNDISLNHDWQTMKNCLEYFSHLRSFSLPLKISCLWKLPHTTKCVLNGSQIFVVNMGFTGIKVFIPFFSSNNWYPQLWFALILY